MGVACARCTELQKHRDRAKSVSESGGLRPPEQDDSSGAGSDGEHSEVAASSDGEHQEHYKQGVEEILTTTGQNLKRGKTMAMKEAITTAKKYGLEKSKISLAEKRLDDHKKRQRQEEAEQEADALMQSPAARDLVSVERMLRRVVDAECREEIIQTLQSRLEELMQTRSLEEAEIAQAQEYLRQSCSDFVLAATRGGRRVWLVDLEKGGKVPGIMILDPPLQHLVVKQDAQPAHAAKEVSVSSLSVIPAKDDKRLRSNPHFGELMEEDVECSVVVRYGDAGSQGVFCFIEPTPLRRDRLIEAVLILATACR